MVEEDFEEIPQDEVFFSGLDASSAIIDSRAARTLVGEDVWSKWVEKYDDKLLGPITSTPVRRMFKFGGGETLISDHELSMNVMVQGQRLPLSVAVAPGPTPFLLARPVLEEWKVKQDFASGERKATPESPRLQP